MYIQKMSQETNQQPVAVEQITPDVAKTEQPTEAEQQKKHEIKMAESYLDEKLKEFFQGKDENAVKPIPGNMVLNLVSEDATPGSILDVKTLTDAANPETATSNITDLNGAGPKTSIRTKEHEGGHPVNINTICLFACKTVEEFNKASNLMMSGVEKLNAARDVVDKVIDKVAIFVPETQRREFSKNIHHGLNRVEEIIEFIVEISKFPNWVNAEKWIMNTLEDLKPRCRWLPCVDRDLKKKIAKRQKESQDLLAAEKKAAREEKTRVDKLVAAEKAEADKKAKEEMKAKKEAEEAEKRQQKEAEKTGKERAKKEKADAERKRKEDELQAKLEELKMTPEEREAKKKAAEEAEKKRKEQEKLDKKAAKLQAELDKLKPKPEAVEVEENKTE